ncbi:MAG: hypothetical protein LBB79_07220, partial [Prevotellaceae bacterium]|nr:hypothetical protein [Prevotellaceae bacterium]
MSSLSCRQQIWGKFTAPQVADLRKLSGFRNYLYLCFAITIFFGKIKIKPKYYGNSRYYAQAGSIGGELHPDGASQEKRR